MSGHFGAQSFRATPGHASDSTQPIPIQGALPPVPPPMIAPPHDYGFGTAQFQVITDTPAGDPPGGPRARGLVGAASKVAVGTMVSRITGFLRTIAIGALLGATLTSDAYNVSNTLPNIVFELLLGGVLTSVIVPLLVRSQKSALERGADPDVYPQRLFTLAVIGLVIASVLAMIAAPLLVSIQGIGPGKSNHAVAVIFAVVLLPQMIFYGIGALAGALLNTRERYAAAAWAPVVNNVVVIVVVIGLVLVNRIGLNVKDGGEYNTTGIVLLGLGTTLGVVCQALVLMRSWRKMGFRWKWRWDFKGTGLGELRGLALWVFGYVALGQIGLTVTSRVAQAGDRPQGIWTQITYSSLLFQLPYGILGVSLLTALMPRMARAAADNDWSAVKGLLATGTRLSGIVLMPVIALFAVLAVPLTLLLLDYGNLGAASARSIGLILATSAFGLVPYAITLLQLRVFYAAKDARTPTLIMAGIIAFKVGFTLACRNLPDEHLAIGLAVANSASFVVGALIGDVVLRRRFGHLGSGRVLVDLVKILLAACVGLAAIIPTFLAASVLFGSASSRFTDLVGGTGLFAVGKLGLLGILVLSGGVGLVVYLLMCRIFQIPEINRLFSLIGRKLHLSH